MIPIGRPRSKQGPPPRKESETGKRPSGRPAKQGRGCYLKSGCTSRTGTHPGRGSPPTGPPCRRRASLMDLAKNLKIECISRLHPSAPWRIRPEQTVAEAVGLMRKEKVGSLLVCAGD